MLTLKVWVDFGGIEYVALRSHGGLHGSSDLSWVLKDEMTNIPLARELHSLEGKYISGSQGQRAGN